jgi:hypothetical protein
LSVESAGVLYRQAEQRFPNAPQVEVLLQAGASIQETNKQREQQNDEGKNGE